MVLTAESTLTVDCVTGTFFIPHHAGPTPSPSKKRNTSEGCQSADYHGEHAQNYKDGHYLLVGSALKWFHSNF